MKKSILGISILVTAFCLFLLLQKDREIKALEEWSAMNAEAIRLARKRADVATLKNEIYTSEARHQEQRNKSLTAQLGDTRAKVAAAERFRQDIGGAESRSLSDLFRDQAMKEMLTNEAKAGVARNVKELFAAGLSDALHLDPERAASLRRLLVEKGSFLWNEMMIPMMTGEKDEAQMAESGKAMRQQLESYDTQLRTLLGDDGFATYQSLEKAQVEREQLKKFGPEMEEAGQPLTAEQRQQLLAVMTEERANFKFQNDLGDPRNMDFDHWYDNFTEDKIEAYVREVEELNARTLQRAATVLTPQQVTALGKFLTRELQQARLTARMTTASLPKHR